MANCGVYDQLLELGFTSCEAKQIMGAMDGEEVSDV